MRLANDSQSDLTARLRWRGREVTESSVTPEVHMQNRAAPELIEKPFPPRRHRLENLTVKLRGPIPKPPLRTRHGKRFPRKPSAMLAGDRVGFVSFGHVINRGDSF